MAENVTIGRTSVYGPFSLREIGPAVTFGFDVTDTGSTVLETQAKIEQLRGLRAGDVIPVTWTEDDRYDGFYRLSAPITMSPNTTYLDTGYVSGVFSGARLPRPEIASFSRYESRTVTGTAASALNMLSLPAGLAGTNAWLSVGTQDRVLNAAGDGAVSIYRYHLATAAGDSQIWVPVPSTFYDGLPMLEQDWGTNDWYPVVGFQIDPEKPLRLSNGYLQCEHSQTLSGLTNTEIGFKFKRLNVAKAFAPGSRTTVYGSSSDPSSYGEEVEMGIDQENATDADYLVPVRVLRNDSACVTVRYRMPHETYSGLPELTASLYRGEPFVRFAWTRGGAGFDGRLEMDENVVSTPSDGSGSFTEGGEGAAPSSSDGWRWWVMGENGDSTTSNAFYDVTDSGSSIEAVWAFGFGEEDNASDTTRIGVVSRIRQWRAAATLHDYWTTT